MKQFYTIILTIAVFFLLGTKQTEAQKCISKGKSLIEVYYGFPNFYATIIKQGYNNNFDLTRGLRPDYQISNLGPLGVKYEYLITDQMGFGLNIFYANTELKWEDATYSYTSSVSRIRANLSFNLHFATTSQFDPYFTAQLGYANFNYQFDQSSKFDSIPIVHPKPDIKFMSPIAFHAGIGARYFFTNNLGIHAEAGIGGIFLTGGLTYKL